MSNVSRSPHEDPQPRTVEITADEACHLRAAIASDMRKMSKVIREHLDEHQGGSSVALADARNWIESLTCEAALLDKIDPPGWRKPFSSEAVASLPERRPTLKEGE